ncbi:MAG: hypothetical protein K5866_09055 [Treponema sp.]|nr:hypothetical protein [Treponema sp.]
MEEELDPEIAALINGADNGDSSEDSVPITVEEIDIPTNHKSLFTKSIDEVVHGGGNKSIHDVDLSKKEFDKIENPLNETPSQVFNDTKYYKTALTGENASAQRVHQVLSKYLTCQDPKDRAVYRQQIVTAYWELIRGMVGKMVDPNVPMPKRMLVRFGVLLPSLFKAEQKDFFSKIVVENRTKEPILYVDEWFKEIATGRMTNSATDEKKIPKKTANMTADEANMAEQSRLMQLQSKNSGKLQSAENLLGIKENERTMLEGNLKEKVTALTEHQPLLGMEPHCQSYTDFQKKIFSEISDIMHRLSKNDKELSKCLSEYTEAKHTYDAVQDKMANHDGAEIMTTNDTEAVKIEFETVRQMAKMTIGRRGNQFPIFTREFYHCTEKGTGSRENVIEIMRWIESIDPGVFCRIHKNIPNRIVPYVCLVPTYGDRGFCWEPFDRYNRVTSRGRIVIPMYPKDLKIAVLTAVADLRWQVAKEKASYYWMEEGLTGQYYQHIEQMKLKGDLKEFFIEDYILWMTKESTGVQRLEKDVRGIFWRNMPFPKELKEELRKRSLVYDELCKKDANREMSDGY